MASCGSRPQDDGYVSLQCPIDRIAGPSDLQCPICKFFFLAWTDDSSWEIYETACLQAVAVSSLGRPWILIIDFYHLIIWLRRTLLQFATSCYCSWATDLKLFSSSLRLAHCGRTLFFDDDTFPNLSHLISTRPDVSSDGNLNNRFERQRTGIEPRAVGWLGWRSWILHQLNNPDLVKRKIKYMKDRPLRSIRTYCSQDRIV